MADNSVTCSMNEPGNVSDNTAMESFLFAVRTEQIGGKTYCTRNHAKANVFDYIQRLYDPMRWHQTLGYLGRMDFKQRAQVA